LRLYSLGVAAEIGLILAAGLGIGAICAAILAGAAVPLILSAALVLSLTAILKIHRSRLQSYR
jgi:hypothetical protein